MGRAGYGKSVQLFLECRFVARPVTASAVAGPFFMIQVHFFALSFADLRLSSQRITSDRR